MTFTKATSPAEDSLAGRKRNEPHAYERASKRSKTAHATSAGVFSCFTLDGNDVNLHRRSTFSPSRKDEVRKIRKKGACLRCRLLKRPCSGEDPCKTCIAAARAAAKSKALMWMECIRPSFQAVNIFEQGPNVLDQSRINSIINDLLNDDVYLDFHIPFALNVEAASSHLARWLTADEAGSPFSVVGVFSCSTNTSLIQNALDPSLGRDLRLFVHLTTHLYTTDMQVGYREYSDEEIQSVRDCVGNRLLSALDPLVRPSEIEASEDKLAKLRSLFLLLLGTIVGMRYTCADVFEQSNAQKTEFESKQEALFRLLCHYLIYIGKATALLEKASDERAILQKWRTQWNKPAAFTWSPTQGLEMHYRIQPPSDFIVSSSEDESLSSIDIDLTEPEYVDQFTLGSDLLKCALCDTFRPSLDASGLCQDCQSTSIEDWLLPSSFISDDVIASFEGDLSFDFPLEINTGSSTNYTPIDESFLATMAANDCIPGFAPVFSDSHTLSCQLEPQHAPTHLDYNTESPLHSSSYNCNLETTTYPKDASQPDSTATGRRSKEYIAALRHSCRAVEIDSWEVDASEMNVDPLSLDEREATRKYLCLSCVGSWRGKTEIHRHPKELPTVERICATCRASRGRMEWCFGKCDDAHPGVEKEKLLI